MTKEHETGVMAEVIVRDYLIGRNYGILETNWRAGHKEVDIIAEKGGKLIIVEVKSRTAGRVERASDLLSYRKMRFLVDAAESYIFRKDLDMEVRFDLGVVIFRGSGYSIEYIESAFIPGVNW